MYVLLRSIGLVIGVLLLALPAKGQVILTLGPPVTDSFPLIKLDVNVTQNGAPAQLISAANFTVREDGIPGNVIGLSGCGGTSSAAIALVVDTSSSMVESLGSGPLKNPSYAKFDDAVSKFLASIPGPSLIALVPFSDSSLYWYPDTINNFYNSSITADTDSLIYHLDKFQYTGETDVVSGIVEGAAALSLSSLPRHIMILVTDDDVTNADSVAMYLKALGIRLYILDVSRDSTHPDYADMALADSTGGGYYAAYDTTLYAPMLLAISHLIFSEHCILEYHSSITCPAWNLHHVRVTLNYKGSIVSADTSYVFGRAAHDSIPPLITLDTPAFISRRIHGYDPFPCQTGMKTLLDSALVNFTIHSGISSADSVSDSLVVTDSLFSADGWILAQDSAGNISRKHIHYSPKPDTHPPQFAQAARTGSQYSEDIQEMLPWDRGIDTIYLSNGVNLRLNSVSYSSAHLAHAFLKILDLRDTATGCLIAVDSVGNRDSNCLEWDGEGADTLPPVITQLPTAEPLVALSGTVTEERLHDRGIKTVSVTPLVNTSAPLVIFDSAAEARVGVTLNDSLFSASALVKAYDSVGNFAHDTFEYTPLPDTHAPICSYIDSGKSAFLFTATDTQAWDRGVAYLLLLGTSSNATAAPALFADAHHAQILVTVTDRTLPATIVVQATDSAGHQAMITVNFVGIPLIPLGDSVIDFGTVVAPANVSRTVMFQNQNDIPISLDLQPLQGDDSVFQVITPTPLTFPAFGTQTLTFVFHPSLIGLYRAVDSVTFHSAVGSVTLLGRSIGTLQLALDTVITRAGDTGELHLSIDAEPKPTNMDTIGFTLEYDPDLLQFSDLASCPNGAIDTGLCIYNAFWSGGTAGNRQAMLIRNNPNAGADLSFGRTELTLPFTTYVARHDSSIIHIVPLNTYAASVLSAKDGLVVTSDICGTPALRTDMNGGDVTLRILSASPNPASSSIVLTLESAVNADAQILLVDVLRTTESVTPAHLITGTHTIILSNLPRISGPYELLIRANGVVAVRRSIEVIH